MPNEFVIKNGFFSQGTSNVTGNLTVTQTISGTTAQFTTITASLLGGINYISTASIANATLTFTKGDNTTFPLVVNNVTTALTASSLSLVGGYMTNLIFGDGSDGSATLDATASFAWATRSGVVYTMTRDALLGDLTINSGVTLRVANFLPYVSGTLTNNGSIDTRGNDAVGGTAGGAIAAAGTWNSAGGPGGNGGTNSTGSGGGGSGGNSIGGGGGGGGAGGVNAGGGGNASATLAATATSYKTIGFMFTRRIANANSIFAINGSGGGGGGGSNNVSATGGGGGSGAGLCGVFCNTLINNGTIQSVGGNGANGSASVGAAGGGGGGSGGPVYVVANKIQTQGTIQSLGGGAGNGAGGGANGTTGSANLTIILRGI